MRVNFLKIPYQPIVALFWFAITGTFVIVQLAYNVFHQLEDIPFEFHLFRVLEAIIADTLSNHLLFEPLLNGVILLSMIMLVMQFIQLVKLNQQCDTFVNSKRNDELTKRLNEKFNKKHLRIQVISESSYIAMTVGFIRPKIILSSGLIDRFDEQELEAILLHEMYHSKFRHPLQFFILTVIAESLAFLPIMRCFVQHYKVWTELLADRFTIHHMGSEIQLARVLLAILKNDTPATSQANGVHFINESVNYRLQQLIDPQTRISVPFFKQKPLVLSVIVLILMTTVFLYGSV